MITQKRFVFQLKQNLYLTHAQTIKTLIKRLQEQTLYIHNKYCTECVVYKVYSNIIIICVFPL